MKLSWSHVSSLMCSWISESCFSYLNEMSTVSAISSSITAGSEFWEVTQEYLSLRLCASSCPFYTAPSTSPSKNNLCFPVDPCFHPNGQSLSLLQLPSRYPPVPHEVSKPALWPSFISLRKNETTQDILLPLAESSLSWSIYVWCQNLKERVKSPTWTPDCSFNVWVESKWMWIYMLVPEPRYSPQPGMNRHFQKTCFQRVVEGTTDTASCVPTHSTICRSNHMSSPLLPPTPHCFLGMIHLLFLSFFKDNCVGI